MNKEKQKKTRITENMVFICFSCFFLFYVNNNM